MDNPVNNRDNMNMENRSKRFEWSALEHHHSGEKSPDWYWGIGIVAIAMAVLATFFGNILFALLILLATFVLFVHKHTHPKMMRYAITRKGIWVGEDLYPYDSLESFWVEDEIDEQILFKSSRPLMTYIILPLPDNVNPDQIREYLLEYLDEEHLEESSIQKFFENMLL